MNQYLSRFSLPEGWVYFSNWQDGIVALIGALLITLMIIWWRQQSNHWFRMVVSMLLAAVILCISSFYFFEVPRYFVSCPESIGCDGWRGFPQPIAQVGVVEMNSNGVQSLREVIRVAPLDFAFNLLILWLLLLGASVMWRLIILSTNWSSRPLRTRLLLILLFGILPWALLPRFLSPPEPTPTGKAFQIANNARRSAEFTYGVTGLWVHQLALEDVRSAPENYETEFCSPQPTEKINQVCMRGYTYFYLPWRRYLIELDPDGVTSCNITELELVQPCW